MFDFLKRKKESQARYMHVAVDIKGTDQYCGGNKVGREECYRRSFSLVKEIVRVQVEQGIPVLSFLILPLQQEEREELLLAFREFIESAAFLEYVTYHKIKITFLGKWYDLSSEMVESLKKVTETTKDYDHFFLNFCLNYDGQEEIVDAFKLIARQLLADKLSLENIDKAVIKENIYSSYFIPPDVMIKNSDNKMDSFLLWDCVGAKRIFTEKDFPALSKSDFEKWLKG